MKIALSTSVMQRGRSGVGQYVISLVRALLPVASLHEFTLVVLEEDLPPPPKPAAAPVRGGRPAR